MEGLEQSEFKIGFWCLQYFNHIGFRDMSQGEIYLRECTVSSCDLQITRENLNFASPIPLNIVLVLAKITLSFRFLSQNICYYRLQIIIK